MVVPFDENVAYTCSHFCNNGSWVVVYNAAHRGCSYNDDIPDLRPLRCATATRD